MFLYGCESTVVADAHRVRVIVEGLLGLGAGSAHRTSAVVGSRREDRGSYDHAWRLMRARCGWTVTG